jgi:hypothetical protein
MHIQGDSLTSTSIDANRRPPDRVRQGHAITWLLATLLLVAATWGVWLRNDLDEAETRVAALQAEVATLREWANATAYPLLPATGAPPNAAGTAFFTLSGTGVISVVNLEPVPDGRSYQVWYYPAPESAPLPGATFPVDENGTGFMLIPADVGVFTNVSVTLEPESGTTVPSGPLILEGATGGARG